MMGCDLRSSEGKCNGQYQGLGCIEEKCRAEKRNVCEFSTPEGSYCLKYHRFECVGAENCGTLEQYLECLRSRNRRYRT